MKEQIEIRSRSGKTSKNRMGSGHVGNRENVPTAAWRTFSEKGLNLTKPALVQASMSEPDNMCVF
jgi:hypothetical protein